MANIIVSSSSVSKNQDVINHKKEDREHSSQIERAALWVCEHHTSITRLNQAVGILGMGLVVSSALTPSGLGSGYVSMPELTGALCTLVSSVSSVALNYFIPAHHDMRNHVYTPGQCDGGRLYYEGDVPILSLDSDDPFTAGKAHGYLCGAAINRVMKQLDWGWHIFFPLLHSVVTRSWIPEPTADALPNLLGEITNTLPPQYLREIEGMVNGYNQWAKEQNYWKFPRRLTVADVLLIHLMPDDLHLPKRSLERANSRRNVACTALVGRDSQNEMVLARNLDWGSFGVFGTYSLIIHRKTQQGLSTVDVGIPGFIGVLTGMNEEGLSIAMNVCKGLTRGIRGMPAAFYNRHCLERCRNIEEVERHTKDFPALGPYHLVVADKNGGESIHFYQGSDSNGEETHVYRHWNEDQPLTTLNYRYKPEPNHPSSSCVRREEVLTEFFRNRNNRPLEDALGSSAVNNMSTMHQVVMHPEARRMRVAFDNSFAGARELQEVPTSKLW